MKFARQQAGYTIAQVAEQFGVTRQAAFLWEKGQVPDARLPKLAVLYGCNEAWLRGEDAPQVQTILAQLQYVLIQGGIAEPTRLAICNYAAALLGSRQGGLQS